MALEIISYDNVEIKDRFGGPPVPGGSIDFIYHCPKCKQELVSTNEDVLQDEDKCPYCNQSFAFDSSIKFVWEEHVAELKRNATG